MRKYLLDFSQPDERQKLEQRKAYIGGYLFLSLYFLINGSIFSMVYKWCDFDICAKLGVVLSLFFIYMWLTIKDAIAGDRQSFILGGLIIIILIGYNLYYFCSASKNGLKHIIENGKLSENGLLLITFLLFIIFGITIIIKGLINRKKEKQDIETENSEE